MDQHVIDVTRSGARVFVRLLKGSFVRGVGLCDKNRGPRGH